ncbi:MAG: hypothetical protein WA110_09090, partial [Anaerolineaceae bacterium]
MKTKKSFFLALISLTLILSLGFSSNLTQAQTTHTDPPTIDGIVDESYGPVIATDPAGDAMGGAPLDLSNLWVTQDAAYFYFAFEVAADISLDNWGKYAIYVDTTGDANGATSDAWGRAVSVSDPHKPEFALYTWVDTPPYGVDHTQVVPWTGSSWDWGAGAQVDAAAIGAGSTSIIEWSLSKAKLGDPDELWMEVWSTGGGGGDNAQDTLNFPADDWNAPDWGTPAVLKVSTPVMLVEGAIEPMYGEALASDPAGDGNGNTPMDLLDLYVTEDASQYYFAYSINSELATANWGKYAIYIDTTNDAGGATTDAWGRNVQVNDPHKPEFGLYTWVDSAPYGIEDTQMVAWTGSGWDWGTSGTLNEAAITTDAPAVIEWAVEKNHLGNPETLWMEVWDTSGGGSDNAQDTINNPADDWNASDWSTAAILSNSTQYPPSTEPPHAGHDNEVWWNELGHDSRDTLYRTPSG